MLKSYLSIDGLDDSDSHQDGPFETVIVNTVWPELIAYGTIDNFFTYDQDVKSFLCSMSNLPWEKVEIIIQSLREPEYFLLLKRLLYLILARIGVVSRKEFLDPAFFHKVRKLIILGKHHKKTKKIVAVANILVCGMFACNCNKMKSLGSIGKSHVMKLVIYILAINMVLSMRVPKEGMINAKVA